MEVQKPGERFGPCEEPCRHNECEKMKRHATSLCWYCHEPIGYEAVHYKIQHDVYAHCSCLEKEQAKSPNYVQRKELRSVVRGYYDIQKLRIACGNRLVDNFKAKLGYVKGEKEEKISSKKAAEVLKKVKTHYKLIADAVSERRFADLAKDFPGDEVISTATEFALVHHYTSLRRVEDEHKKRIEYLVRGLPLYDNYLSQIDGIGPVLSAVCLTELDPYKAPYPSSFWAYSGLDVAGDGRGRGKYPEHLVDREYVDRDGKRKTKKSITFNPFLKSKMCEVMPAGFCKLKTRKPDGKYVALYFRSKEWAEHEARFQVPEDADMNTKKRINAWKYRTVNRLTAKPFLLDLHLVWREMENLPVPVPYSER